MGNKIIEDKIVKILIDELCYCYCDNCEFGNWDEYQDEKCDNCHRKYQNWRLSKDTARSIAKQIIEEINNIELIAKQIIIQELYDAK